MHRIDARLLVTVLAITAAGFASQAQTAPPIKPGLWQIHSEREVNGQKQPDASERMKNMTPEKRAQIEAMMKQHGVGRRRHGPGLLHPRNPRAVTLGRPADDLQDRFQQSQRSLLEVAHFVSSVQL